MQRSRFLAEILTTLFDRGPALGKDSDARDIYALCQALLSEEGEVSGQKIASSVLSRYRGLDDPGKAAFFTYLNDALDLDGNALARLANNYAQTPTHALFEKVTRAAEPKRQELLRRLNQPAGATAELVAMRVDLLRQMKSAPALARTNADFVHLLRSWFNRGFLVLQQINWDTPARILDKIVAYEAVHQIDDWDDLRRRLDPPDRRCFAFFHPAIPDEPLIFVELALTADVPNSIDQLLSEDRDPIGPEDAKVAVFYSISNCQKGLSGISFGNLLIKQVVTELSLAFPQLTHFVTLSPIPGFNRWLSSQADDPAHGYVATALLDGTAHSDDSIAMAAHYLLGAKRDDGQPIDPVARFHLGNGAQVHALHAGADLSKNGSAQSCGVMVNYLYDPSKTETYHEDFALRGIIAASKTVKALTTAQFTTEKVDVAP